MTEHAAHRQMGRRVARPSPVAARHGRPPMSGASIGRPRGRRTGRCSACGASRKRPHGAARRARTHAVVGCSLACPDGAFRRSARCTRPPSGWSARSAICSGSFPRALRRAALARPRPLGRRIRSAATTSGPQPRLSVPARRGRGPASDSGRPGACRHHRARPFPLHGQGETVVRLEERLGYVHKGIDHLMTARR